MQIKMDYVDFIVSENRKRKPVSFDGLDYTFFCSKDIKPLSRSGIWFSSQVIVFHENYLERCSFWVHEFTELAVVKLLDAVGINWRKEIKMAGFKSTTISHLISPMGARNKRCLIPETQKSKTIWGDEPINIC